MQNLFILYQYMVQYMYMYMNVSTKYRYYYQYSVFATKTALHAHVGALFWHMLMMCMMITQSYLRQLQGCGSGRW